MTAVRRPACLAAALALAALAAPLAAQLAPGPPGPHDMRTQEVVLALPGMERVEVRPDLPYKEAEGRRLTFDLYLPPAGGAAAARPAVVFANGVGDGPAGRLKDWGQYRSWARLVAASGFAAVTAEARGGGAAAEDLRDLLAHLRAEGGKLGLDPGRLAVWACSANVSSALPVLMSEAGTGTKAAVVYYGAADLQTFRPDLPVQVVRAGIDGKPLHEAIGRMLAAALAANAPWSTVNLPTSPHAFDVTDDREESRDAIRQTLAFLAEHLRPEGEGAPPRSAARDGLLAWNLGNFPRAIETYGRFASENPADSEALYRLGSSQAMIKQHEAAIESLTRATAASPRDSRIWGMLGFTQLALKRYGDAAASYEKAIAIGPALPSLYFNLACAKAGQGRKDEAFQALDRAIAAGFTDAKQLAEDPDLESLRSDPRFAEAKRRLDRG